MARSLFALRRRSADRGTSRSRTAPRWRRVATVLALLVVLLALAVAGTSGYVGWRLTHPGRDYATQTPAAVGLAYSAVQFPSRDGQVPLSGWLEPRVYEQRVVAFFTQYLRA